MLADDGTPTAGRTHHTGRLLKLSERLRKYATEYETRHDSRCVFAYAYAEETRVLANGVPGTAFKDPERVVALAEAFAARFMAAMDAYDEHREVPRGWNAVLKPMLSKQTSVLEDLVLGMYAHIVHDLPLALNDICVSSERDLYDFQLMNDVLGKSIGAIQNKVSRRYCPFIHWLDRLGRQQDEIATNYGIRLGRAAAWYNAERLRLESTASDAYEAISRSPEVFARAILHPQVWSVDLLFRAVRLAASVSRRWPASGARAPGIPGSSAR
jgi:Family of unknown function (DUF5995)